jgi:hypothetical protein
MKSLSMPVGRREVQSLAAASCIRTGEAGAENNAVGLVDMMLDNLMI